VSVKCTVDESGCQNHPGPTVTVGGEIALGSVTARITFSNNTKGTHTATVQTQYDVALLLGDSTITIPKQPVLGGVGVHPYIYFQFTDSKSNAVSEEVFLGRCVQGLTVTSELVQQAALFSHIVADCSNHPGPFITLDGTIKLAGLNGKLIFRNNVKGTHTAEVSTTVAIIAEGTDIVLRNSRRKVELAATRLSASCSSRGVISSETQWCWAAATRFRSLDWGTKPRS
jgi:hypothetical protein